MTTPAQGADCSAFMPPTDYIRPWIDFEEKITKIMIPNH
jgi:hypothetical protein